MGYPETPIKSNYSNIIDPFTNNKPKPLSLEKASDPNPSKNEPSQPLIVDEKLLLKAMYYVDLELSYSEFIQRTLYLVGWFYEKYEFNPPPLTYHEININLNLLKETGSTTHLRQTLMACLNALMNINLSMSASGMSNLRKLRLRCELCLTLLDSENFFSIKDKILKDSLKEPLNCNSKDVFADVLQSHRDLSKTTMWLVKMIIHHQQELQLNLSSYDKAILGNLEELYIDSLESLFKSNANFSKHQVRLLKIAFLEELVQSIKAAHFLHQSTNSITNAIQLFFDTKTFKALSDATSQKDSLNQSMRFLENASEESFYDFATVIKESIDYFIEQAELYDRRLVLIANFHLYMKFASPESFNKLKINLEKCKGDISKVILALEQKILPFARNLNESKKNQGLNTREDIKMSILRKTAQAYLNSPENKVLKSLNEITLKRHECWSKVIRLAKSTLDIPLTVAIKNKKNFQIDNFIYPHTIKINSRFSPVLSSNTVGTHELNAPSEQIQEVTLESTVKEKTSAIKLSLFQSAKTHLDEGFDTLFDACDVTATKEAMKNCKGHLKTLLYSLKSLSLHPLSNRKQVMLFVLNSVRHSTLATEQMLTALAIQNSPEKSDDKLKNLFTHDLVNLLINSNISLAMVPASLRKWTHFANLGGLKTRQLNQCQFGTASVESLLAKTYAYANGNDAFDARDILEDALLFMEKAVELFEALSPLLVTKEALINTPKENPSYKFAYDFRQQSKQVSKSIRDTDSYMELPKEFEFTFCTKLKQQLDFISKLDLSSYSEAKLDNIVNNLLVQLESEMQSQKFLNPIDAYLHLRNVYFINQLISEELLLICIEIKNTPLNYENNNDLLSLEEKLHDLISIANKLKLKLSKNVSQFLQRSVSTRKAVRYPFFFISKPNTPHANHIFEKLIYAEKISNKQSLEESYEFVDAPVLTVKVAKELNRVKDAARADVELLGELFDCVLNEIN